MIVCTNRSRSVMYCNNKLQRIVKTSTGGQLSRRCCNNLGRLFIIIYRTGKFARFSPPDYNSIGTYRIQLCRVQNIRRIYPISADSFIRFSIRWHPIFYRTSSITIIYFQQNMHIIIGMIRLRVQIYNMYDDDDDTRAENTAKPIFAHCNTAPQFTNGWSYMKHPKPLCVDQTGCPLWIKV